jgi:hypothetical protein
MTVSPHQGKGATTEAGPVHRRLTHPARAAADLDLDLGKEGEVRRRRGS